MRLLVFLTAVILLSGCSFLDKLSLSGSGTRLDPSKIYLGHGVVTTAYRDVDRYACVSGPLFCEYAGAGFECRCVY